MNQQSEPKQKIEPEHCYRASYRRTGRSLKPQLYAPRRLGGTSLGMVDDDCVKNLHHDIIGIVTGLCLFVILIALAVAWNRYGTVESNDFISALMRTFIVLPLPFFMLCYRVKNNYGSILQLCGLIVPVAITVMAVILCLSDPIAENGIALILITRRVAILGTLIYALLQTLALCAHHFYKKYKQD